MSYKLFIYIIATFMITIFGCRNGKKTSSPDTLDLMKYGVPYTINAPDDVKVAKVGAGKLEDISIKN